MVQRGLEERLTQLGDGQVETVTPSTDELWERGRRWGRRSRMVNVGVAVCTFALLAGIGVWSSSGLRGTESVRPAGAAGEVAVPATVHTSISSRMPYLEDPGELVAVTGWSHTTWWGRSKPAIAAISARTGEYGFVQTPDMAQGSYALSPGGTHLAYWTEGAPSGTPSTTSGDGAARTGVAVLDAVSGEVVRHEIETEHGLSDQELFWLDDRNLFFFPFHMVVGDDGPADRQDASSGEDAYVLDASTGEVSVWRWPEHLPVFGTARSTEGTFINPDGEVLVDHRSGRVTKVGLPEAPDGLVASRGVLSPEGDIARVVHGEKNIDTGQTSIWVAPLGRPDTTGEWREVPSGGAQVNEVLGWREGKVVALTGREEQALALVDPESGTQETLVDHVDEARGDGSVGWSWATDLLQTADVGEGGEPAHPVNPLLVLGAVVAVLVAAATTLVGWRRRGHP